MDRYESNGPPSHVTILAPPLRQVDLHGLLQSRKHVCAGSGLELKDRMTPHVNFFQQARKEVKDGMGNAGKRKEMVKDWRVQQGTRV